MAKHNEIGRLGEEIAASFLERKGLKILEKNYWKPYGEIDIVARLPADQAGENKQTRFVEVKTVSHETTQKGFRAEENVHHQKLKRLARVIESYIISHETGEWAFDVLVVYVDTEAKKAKVKWLKDIVIDV